MGGGREGDIDAAQSAYEKLISRFCPPGFRHEPIAFGSESSHDGNDVILGTEMGTDSCIVRARHDRSNGNIRFETEYEYHLRKAESRWHLTNLFYVDRGGNYECL